MSDSVKEEPLEQVEAPKTTPKKRKAPTKSSTDSTPKKSKLSNEGKKVDEQGFLCLNSLNTSQNTPSKIPTSEEELTDADRVLIKMKEVRNTSMKSLRNTTDHSQEGKSSAEIDAQWEMMTFIKPAPRSLITRYHRLKASLARVKDDDIETLKQSVEKAKNEIEEEKRALDKKLWAKVVAAMEEAGTEKYGTGTVEKEWKKIESAK